MIFFHARVVPAHEAGRNNNNNAKRFSLIPPCNIICCWFCELNTKTNRCVAFIRQCWQIRKFINLCWNFIADPSGEYKFRMIMCFDVRKLNFAYFTTQSINGAQMIFEFNMFGIICCIIWFGRVFYTRTRLAIPTPCYCWWQHFISIFRFWSMWARLRCMAANCGSPTACWLLFIKASTALEQINKQTKKLLLDVVHRSYSSHSSTLLWWVGNVRLHRYAGQRFGCETLQAHVYELCYVRIMYGPHEVISFVAYLIEHEKTQRLTGTSAHERSRRIERERECVFVHDAKGKGGWEKSCNDTNISVRVWHSLKFECFAK